MSLPSIHHRVDQGTEEWFQLRMGRFTASSIDKLLGGPKNKGYQDEIKRVAFEMLYGVRPDGFESSWMTRGKDLEADARDAYQATTFTVVDTCGFFTYGDSIGASPDGLIGDDGTVEIKCVKYNTFIDYVIADRVPPEYVPQIQTQLLCTDRQWCDFIAYHPGVPLFIKRIERDEELIQNIIVAVDVAMASAKELVTKIKKNG
jgi:putative phage-type endonuclease